MSLHRLLTAAATGAVLSLGALPAAAQSSGIELELNTAADLEGSCRLTYVATNTAAGDLDQASYEVAVFDAQGIVTRLLVLEFGALPSGKTRVVQFDVPQTACNSISRILSNGPVDCTGGGARQPTCDRPILSSRVGTIQFN